MPDQIRYHRDESVPVVVADALRRRGINVSTSREIGLLSATDEEQLRFATGDRRVLITRDRDFLRMQATGIAHAGIVYWTPSQKDLSELINTLTLLAQVYTSAEMISLVEYL
jgi:predicted nuclease of predicted toxin-antitoxin system